MPEQVDNLSTLIRPKLFAALSPYMSTQLRVGDGHTLYVECCGNPDGIPVIVLHGGPGGGCTPFMRRYFDPARFRIILFDQRGCGRSTPHASIENNTSQHLVADIERIRAHFGIESWMLFGGSWGATLALLYAQAHPMRVRAMVLRGVFTMTRAELDWFYGGGAARFWPDAWDAFCAPIPQDERGDMIAAYRKRLFGADEAAASRAALAWTGWENALAFASSDGKSHGGSAHYAGAFARIENHYFHHGGFLRSDDQIMQDMPRIAHIPAIVVQGRYDMICPPVTAARLVAAWPRAELQLVGMSGHAMSEPKITEALLAAVTRLGAGLNGQ
ncbi:prolyl aminopeptidase [Abyssibius alkaniclasticus]|uniref:prolyl aminopeptidase n=1 Tax=Abyssibius alkaniclasticus TaxID=2881234 RepID=UPI003B67F470